MLKLILVIFSTALLCSCSTSNLIKRSPISAKISSLVFTGYNQISYSEKRVNSYLNELKELNINTASFLYTCYTDNIKSHNIDCGTYRTPKLNHLAKAIETAKKRNFQVSVRFYVDIANGTWRCKWDPSDKKTLFNNFNQHFKYFSKLIEKRKVDLLVIGSEYCKLTGQSNTDYWRTLVSNIRQNFKGKITYAANGNEYNKSYEFKSIGFWNSLDYIGINHYHPIPLEYQDEEILDFQKHKINEYINVAKIENKEIVITEFGFPGYKGARLSPYEWRKKTKSDQKDQAMLYRESLSAFKIFSHIKGVFIWRKLSLPVEVMQKYNKNETDYGLYKREAWYEIQKYFSNYK